jgi:hypothetical protein
MGFPWVNKTKMETYKENQMERLWCLSLVPVCSSLFDQTENKADNGHDRKNKEKNFCNLNGTRSNTAEAEHGSNQCDDQKNNRIVKHHNLPDEDEPEVNRIEKLWLMHTSQRHAQRLIRMPLIHHRL